MNRNGAALFSSFSVGYHVRELRRLKEVALNRSSHAHMHVTHVINVTHMYLVCKDPKSHPKGSPMA